MNNRTIPIRRTRATGILYGVMAILMMGVSPASPAVAPVEVQAPDSLTDREFWKFFTTMSEPDGYFLSENFVSNEVSFQEVIPTLQHSLTKDGVYLGVGPEQNFTYIANLAPRMAVIFDIRRQNAMHHLMYKALFELSPTRVDFVARLFSRPSVARQADGISAAALFDSATAAPPSDSAYKANLATIIELLTVKHGFTLPVDDIASIEHVYKVFFAAGPEVNYGYRPGNSGYQRSPYPTFGQLQAATNADSVVMAFLATEANYQAVRRLQLRNLIVPVVGDFAGPAAIRAVGSWLTERRMTVTAFYVSNVEQYLFRDRATADRFYNNLTALPLDTTSMFIRSVPRGSGSVSTFSPATGGPVPQGIVFTVYRDSFGLRSSQTTQDSAGQRVIRTTVDTIKIVPRDSVPRDTSIGGILSFKRDSIAKANQWQSPTVPMYSVVRGGGLLASGLASMKKTLEAFVAGQLTNYNAIIDMTKVDGWR